MKGNNNNSNNRNNQKSGNGSNNSNNGHRRSNSRFNGNSQPSSTSSESNLNNERLLFLISKSIGQTAVATLTSGARYQGTLLSSDISALGSAPLSVILAKPAIVSKAKTDEKTKADSNDLPEKMVIDSEDLIDLEVAGINIGKDQVSQQNKPVSQPQPQQQKSQLKSPSYAAAAAAAAPPPQPAPQPQSHRAQNKSTTSNKSESKFKTDSDISSQFQFRERELQRWVPDDDGTQTGLDDETFGDLGSSSGSGAWDQFKVNEEKFGVESSYDEHLYTTRINTSAPDFKERVERAERLAREIESQSTTDRHILEERGLEVDYGDEDEEDKYSGVDRRGDELMAALRNASISNDSSSKNFAPGKYVPPKHRAAQYHNDPAIVSSSATKRQAEAASAQQQSDNQQSKVPAKPDSTSSRASAVPTKPNSIPPKPPVANQHNESFRLNAQSEINSLREFSANFKIPHKMPTDLLPILAKDKLKQDEILKKQQETQRRKELLAQEKQKQEEAKDLKQKSQSSIPSIPPNQPQSQKSQHTSPSPKQHSSQPATQQPTPQAQKKKMDPTKPAFKLNPKAAVFTPSQKHNQLSPNPPKAQYQRSPINPSPRMNNQRPYSSGSVSNSSTSGSSKRHYQINPVDFFGGADKIPTKEGQEEKIKKFKSSFNIFVTAQVKHEDKSSPLFLEKSFQTPPTWTSTIDGGYETLFPSPSVAAKPMGNMMLPATPSLPFVPNVMMNPNHPGAANHGLPGPGYPTAPNGSKFPLSPQQQQQQQQQQAAAMAHFQQQQFHAAMLYQQQQFQGGIPPGQPPVPMYMPGAEASPFIPPGGFMMPPGGAYVGGGSPVNVNAMMFGGAGGNSPAPYGDMSSHNYGNHNHGNGGNRRFNNHGGKRGSNN